MWLLTFADAPIVARRVRMTQKQTWITLLAVALAGATLWLFLPRHAAATIDAANAPATGSGEATTQAPQPVQAVTSAQPVTAAAPQRAEAAPDDTGPPFMRVHVLDPDGQGIDGATVESFDDSTPGKVVTGSDGWCTLPVRVDAGQAILCVNASPLHWQNVWRRNPEVTIRLVWAGPLHGLVVDDRTGAPVASAAVLRAHRCKGCGPDRTATAADGTFTFPGVPHNHPCRIFIESPQHPNQSFELPLPDERKPVEHTFRLLGGVWIAGRVVDLEDRRPIVATLTADLAKTEAPDGRFRMLALPGKDGAVGLRCESAEHLPVTFRVNTPQPDANGEFPLPRGAAFTGTVRNELGQPIAGAYVTGHHDGPMPAASGFGGLSAGCSVSDLGSYVLDTQTDRDGRYRLTPAMVGQGYRLRARHPDHDSMPDADPFGVVVQAKSEGVAVDFTLHSRGAAGAIRGTYTFQGAPAAAHLSWTGKTRHGDIIVAQNGSFGAKDLECGTVVLTAVPEVWWQGLEGTMLAAVVSKREVRIEPGGLLELQLDHRVEELRIQGHVRFPDGTPAPTRWVAVHTRSINMRMLTQADGGFEFHLPKAASVPIRVAVAGQTREVSASANDVDFVVAAEGVLRLRAVAADDGKWVVARWDLRNQVSADYQALGLGNGPEEGGYLGKTLDRGAYFLLARAAGYGPVLQPVSVGTDPAELTVRMPRATTITVRLRADAAPPPDLLRVTLIDEPFVTAGIEPPQGPFAEARPAVELAKGGTFADVASGRHRLASSDPAIEILPAVLEVVLGSPTTFELSWRGR